MDECEKFRTGFVALHHIRAIDRINCTGPCQWGRMCWRRWHQRWRCGHRVHWLSIVGSGGAARLTISHRRNVHCIRSRWPAIGIIGASLIRIDNRNDRATGRLLNDRVDHLWSIARLKMAWMMRMAWILTRKTGRYQIGGGRRSIIKFCRWCECLWFECVGRVEGLDHFNC